MFCLHVCVTCLSTCTGDAQLEFAGREELCCFSDFAAIVCILTCLLQWRKKMFLDRGTDLPKEPRRYCGILFLILQVWFFSGDGGAGAPPAPPLLTPVYWQEYIIKERREYRTRLCSALNVCGESRAWNANYLTTISEYVIVYKRPRAFPS